MDQVKAILSPAYAFVHGAFADVKSQVVALVIALLAALVMKGWGRIWAMTLACVVVQLLIVMFLPVIQGGRFVIPDFLTAAFWAHALGLYVGFLLVLAFFYFLKRNVLKLT